MSRFLILSLIMLTANLAQAQDTHVHDHGATPPAAPPAEAAVHNHENPAAAEPTLTASAPSVMDHGAMPMGSETPPVDARDPHAYSAGFTQTEGPYTLPNAQHSMHGFQEPILSILGDRLEYDPDSNTGNYELQAWRGTSFNRFIIKSEGRLAQHNEYANQTDLLWGRALAPFWDSQLGLRIDSASEGKNRQWLAAGVQGLAPYWFELDATAYIGTQGQSEIAFDSEYELLLSQRLILQPRFELTVRGKDDSVNLLGSGLANASFSLRLRYEFSRQFAPYLGVETEKSFGNTADLVRAAGEKANETHYFAGVRFWF